MLENLFLFRASYRFLSKPRRTKYFVNNETEPERQQNQQATNTKHSQEVKVTVTEDNQKLMPEKAGTKFVSTPKLITPVTRLKLYGLVIGQIAKQQYSPSLKKKLQL